MVAGLAGPVVAVAAALVALTALPYLLFGVLYAVVSPDGSPADKREPDTLPSVSVVLPTYNEERIVERKLEDLFAVDYPLDRMEVVVVDSSDDRTPETIEEYFEENADDGPVLNLICEKERRGLAPALNDAYAAAENEVVVKTDCDSFLAEDALREAVTNLTDPQVAAVTGRNAEVLGGSEVEAGYRGVQAYVQTLESHLDSTFIFHGPFSAFENDAVVPVDPNSLADDTELALRIRRTQGFDGGRVVYDPAVRYREASHSAFGKRRTQKDRRGMGLIRLLVQYRDALFSHGRYGSVVLPFNWWFMLLSPWFVALSVVAVSAAAVSVAGVVGAAVPVALLGYAYLGQRDLLGPLGAPYAVLDTQVSLARAAVDLLRGKGDGTWEVDAELREAYE
ncbi:glycosyl transferase family 2 [Halobacteriales archaeon SW_5_70_135]|nr:MAG: glycosyl transferase family 2 [Halobacteriales archaeon SW_5_70_135]